DGDRVRANLRGLGQRHVFKLIGGGVASRWEPIDRTLLGELAAAKVFEVAATVVPISSYDPHGRREVQFRIGTLSRKCRSQDLLGRVVVVKLRTPPLNATRAVFP